MLGDDVPDGSQEVGQDQDEDDQSEHSEDVHDDDLDHDLIVVFFVVLLAGGVAGDCCVQTRTEHGLDDALEGLDIQNGEHLLDTEQSQAVEQNDLVISDIAIFQELLQREGRQSEHVKHEGARDVAAGDLLDVAHRLLQLLILVLSDEGDEHVDQEEDLHGVVQDLKPSLHGGSETGIVCRGQSGGQGRKDQKHLKELQDRVVWPDDELVQEAGIGLVQVAQHGAGQLRLHHSRVVCVVLAYFYGNTIYDGLLLKLLLLHHAKLFLIGVVSA